MASAQQAFSTPMFAKTLIEDKQQFFKTHPTSVHPKINIHRAAQNARDHDFTFLSSQRFPMEEEFRYLFTVLNDEDRTQEKDAWLYCYYCCIMLSEYYREHHYNSPEKHANYIKLAAEIEHHYIQGKFPKEKLRTWKAHLKADLADLLSTPFHLSKIRNWLGFANAYRIAFTFSRLTEQQFFLAVNQWSQFLRNKLHLPFDLDQINRNINRPTPTFRALSVGLFIARFLVNISLVLKHTFFPTSGEANIPASKRFYLEIKKRYPQLLNDLVWGTANALANFAAYFRISNPVANGITIAALVFDFSLLAYRYWEAEHEFEIKLKQYLQEKQNIHQQLKQLGDKHPPSSKSRTSLEQQLAILNAQIAELDIKRRASQAYFHMNLFAAVLNITGFSISLLIASPAAIGACYFLIVLGTALYICADQFQDYKEKALRQTCLPQKGSALKEAKLETALAWKNFTTSMLKNIVMPLLIMGTLAFSWQAALVLLVLFIGHEYATKYKQTDTAYRTQNLFSKPENVPSKDKIDIEKQAPTVPCAV